MKRFFALTAVVAVLCMVLCACTSPVSDELRCISMEGSWKFKAGEYVPGETLTDSVQLPGTTDTNHKGDSVEISFREDAAHVGELVGKWASFTNRLSRLYAYTGRAVFEKEVAVPESWSDKDILLVLERSRETRVWVGGIYAGRQTSLGTAQVYDLSEQIVPGQKNRITVEVDNENYSAGRWILGSHMATEETTTNWNGIIGKMQLLAKDRIHIKHVSVYPLVDEKIARVRIELKSSVTADGTIKLKASSRNGTKRHNVKAASVDFRSTGEDLCLTYDYPLGDRAELWSEFSPALYDLTLSLSADGGRLKDQKTVSFGMREFKTASDNRHFSVNGKLCFLRGEANCNVFPATGYCPMSKAEWLDFLRKFQAFGVNHMRFHTWCPPEAAFEAADELGIYMQPELYLFGGRRATDPFSHDEVYAYMKEEGERILRAYANHPSFVMLSFGNEGATADPRKKDLYDHFKAIDPSRLYSEGTATFFWIAEKGDSPVGDFRTSYKTGRGYCRMQFYCEDHPQSASYDYDELIDSIRVPFIAHEVGQCIVFPDYAEIEKYQHTVFRAKNLEFFRDMLIEKGMLDQNLDFHRATGRWATIFQREELETIFRSAKMAGFQFLSFQDFPGQGTALVGAYDALMNLKDFVRPEEVQKYNSAVVQLAVFPKYVWTSGERFTAELKVSNYGPVPLRDVVLRWTLKDEAGNAAASGRSVPAAVEQGTLKTVGTIDQPLDLVASAQKLSLEIRMESTGRSTEYDLWVYPDKTDVSVPDGIHVSRHFDDRTKRILRAGGKVLLVPDPAELNPARSITGKFLPDFWSKIFHRYDQNDSYTMGMLIKPDHPALHGFPTDFHTNWQWYDLIKASRSVILDDTPHAYRPIVQTIDHFDRNHKLGNIFEARVGPGKILVCTFDVLALSDSRPEARQLYRSLLDYMDDEAFHPADNFGENFFEGLIGSEYKTYNPLTE